MKQNSLINMKLRNIIYKWFLFEDLFESHPTLYCRDSYTNKTNGRYLFISDCTIKIKKMMRKI